MPFRFAVLWIVLAAVAFAQAPPDTRVFTFVHNESPQQVQETVNIVRSIGEIANVRVDQAQHSMTVAGNADQLGLTSWLFTELDKPAGPSPSTLLVRETTFNDPRAPVVKIFHLAHISSPQQLQEMVNAIRSVSELQRVVALTALSTIIARGAAEQAALAEWIVRDIDQAMAGQGSRAVREYFYPDSGLRIPDRRTTAVRIYYPTQAANPQDLQEMVNGIRSIAELQRAVAFTGTRAIIVRGSTDQAAIADWLVKELDQPAPAGHEYRVPSWPDGVVRSVFLPKNTSVQQLTAKIAEVRAVSGIQRAVGYSTKRALLMRGTPEQIAKAQTALLP